MPGKPLSFVIATLNEEKNIDNLLKDLRSQIEKDDEVIVVDSQSTDKTVEAAEKHGAKVITQPKKGIGFAKTTGAKEAKNSVLVFLDADCRLSPDFAERIRAHFSNKDIVALGGLGLYDSEGFHKSVYDFYSRIVFYSSKLLHRITGKYWLPANNCAFDKETFFSVGGYHSVVCEDTDMMFRMPPSRKVVYDDKLKLVLSDRRFRENGFFRTLFLWGWSDVAALFGKGKKTSGYRTG